MFWTQWFIGQYCSEREGRGHRCRCTSVPLSLYFISILWLHSTDDWKGDGFFLFQTITGAQARFFFYFYNAFTHFFSTFSIRPSILSLFHCPTGHESRRFQCQSRIKIQIYWCVRWIKAQLNSQRRILRDISQNEINFFINIETLNRFVLNWISKNILFFHCIYHKIRELNLQFHYSNLNSKEIPFQISPKLHSKFKQTFTLNLN